MSLSRYIKSWDPRAIRDLQLCAEAYMLDCMSFATLLAHLDGRVTVTGVGSYKLECISGSDANRRLEGCATRGRPAPKLLFCAVG